MFLYSVTYELAQPVMGIACVLSSFASRFLRCLTTCVISPRQSIYNTVDISTDQDDAVSTSAALDNVASTFIATDDATGEAADTGTTGGSSTATGGTSAASKGVQEVCDVCDE